MISLFWTLILVFLPGFALARAMRIRGWTAVAAAPAVTYGLIGVATFVYTRFGIPWLPFDVLAGILAVIALGGLAVTVLLRVLPAGRREEGTGDAETGFTGGSESAAGEREAWRRTVLVVAALTAVATAASAWVTRWFDGPSQIWDSHFHAAAIRWIADTRVASPWSLTPLNHPGSEEPMSYPDVFHALAALVLRLPGGGMPDAFDAALVVQTTVLVIGAAALTAELTRGRIETVAAAGIVATLPTPFLALVGWGALAPFLMAVSAGPGFVLLALRAVRDPRAGVIPVLGVAAAGMFLGHPGAAAGVFIAATLVGFGEFLHRDVRHARVLAVVAAAGVGAALSIRPFLGGSAVDDMKEYDWPARFSVAEGTARAVLFGASTTPNPIWPVLLALGLVVAIRRRGVFLPATQAVTPGAAEPNTAFARAESSKPGRRSALILAAVAVAFLTLDAMATGSDSELTQKLTFIWWNDRYRLEALAAITGVVPMAVGAGAIARDLGRRLRVVPAGAPRRAGAVFLIVAALMAVVPSTAELTRRTRMSFELDVVTDAERRAYAEFAKIYDGGAVLNDPYDGSTWLYSLEGIPVLFGVIPNTAPGEVFGPDRLALFDGFQFYAAGAPHVVDAVEKLDVRWVVIGRGREGGDVFFPVHWRHALVDNPRLEPVLEMEDFTAYRVLRG